MNRRAGPTPESGRDRGSATVWTAVLAASLCVVFAAVLAMGQAVLARHRAGGAADLAALAAADLAPRGPEAACRAAAKVAAAQTVRLVRCAVIREVADVTAEADWGPYTSAVRSRAGPGAGSGAPDGGVAPGGVTSPSGASGRPAVGAPGGGDPPGGE